MPAVRTPPQVPLPGLVHFNTFFCTTPFSSPSCTIKFWVFSKTISNLIKWTFLCFSPFFISFFMYHLYHACIMMEAFTEIKPKWTRDERMKPQKINEEPPEPCGAFGGGSSTRHSADSVDTTPGQDLPSIVPSQRSPGQKPWACILGAPQHAVGSGGDRFQNTKKGGAGVFAKAPISLGGFDFPINLASICVWHKFRLIGSFLPVSGRNQSTSVILRQLASGRYSPTRLRVD